MKKFICIIIISLLISNVYSQRLHYVPYYDWNSHTAFMLSPSPLITGQGLYSDSLSRAHNDSTFYEYNGVYYPITSWADYFYWYVDKYWYQFNFPELYKFYYESGNNLEMARYICGDGFKEYMYPCRIVLDFRNQDVPINYLSRQCVKEYLKIDAKEESSLADANSNAIQHSKRELLNTNDVAKGNVISEFTQNKDHNMDRTDNRNNRQENVYIHAIRESGLGRNDNRYNSSSAENYNSSNRGGSNENTGGNNFSNSTGNYTNSNSGTTVNDTRQSTGSTNVRNNINSSNSDNSGSSTGSSNVRNNINSSNSGNSGSSNGSGNSSSGTRTVKSE
jgi:hypothetical protein